METRLENGCLEIFTAIDAFVIENNFRQLIIWSVGSWTYFDMIRASYIIEMINISHLPLNAQNKLSCYRQL